ncbi:hypothetical protein C8F01DRAFT_1099433 [Mycena amicta]|nr:hypothetical protein C8F01DRAFT_1099433 [Mycena amicta]
MANDKENDTRTTRSQRAGSSDSQRETDKPKPKPKARALVFPTDQQLEVLKTSFRDCDSPDKTLTADCAAELVAKTGLTRKWIGKWWSRAKINFKKSKQQNPDLISEAESDDESSLTSEPNTSVRAPTKRKAKQRNSDSVRPSKRARQTPPSSSIKSIPSSPTSPSSSMSSSPVSAHISASHPQMTTQPHHRVDEPVQSLAQSYAMNVTHPAYHAAPAPLLNYSVARPNVSFANQHPRQLPQLMPTAFNPSAAQLHFRRTNQSVSPYDVLSQHVSGRAMHAQQYVTPPLDHHHLMNQSLYTPSMTAHEYDQLNMRPQTNHLVLNVNVCLVPCVVLTSKKKPTIQNSAAVKEYDLQVYQQLIQQRWLDGIVQDEDEKANPLKRMMREMEEGKGGGGGGTRAPVWEYRSPTPPEQRGNEAHLANKWGNTALTAMEGGPRVTRSSLRRRATNSGVEGSREPKSAVLEPAVRSESSAKKETTRYKLNLERVALEHLNVLEGKGKLTQDELVHLLLYDERLEKDPFQAAMGLVLMTQRGIIKWKA